MSTTSSDPLAPSVRAALGRLTHSILEVRVRALDSIAFKLSHGLAQPDDLLPWMDAIRTVLDEAASQSHEATQRTRVLGPILDAWASVEPVR